MPAKQKDIVVALRNQGKSYREIAQIANVSEANARSICSRVDKTCADGLCRFCGINLTYVAGKKQKQFCSDKCRSDWHNQQNQHKPYDRVCEYCGDKFVSFGYPNKRFCSRNCRTLARRRGVRNDK